MAEPLFDPSLKKRKKKAVAFTEDPLGADADPTKPAPDVIENTTIQGETVDLGGETAHEQMQKSEAAGDDFKAMFGDVKKKKKKKEIPLDFDAPAPAPAAVPPPSADAAAAPAAAIATDDLDFSDIKKKKKGTKKKMDFEAFEKELELANTSSKAAPVAADGDDDDDVEPNPNVNLDDDADLGDDPFAVAGDAPVGVDAGTEAWLGSDRDYTYQEVTH